MHTHMLLLISHPTMSDSCDPMNCSTPGLPVHQQLLELAQTHVHWVGDATQPSHPLTRSSPSALNLSQHQGLFQWVLCSDDQNNWSFSFSIALPMSIQGWFPLRLTSLIFLQSKGPQFEVIDSLMFCLLKGPALTTMCDHWKDHSLDYRALCRQSNVSAFQHTV